MENSQLTNKPSTLSLSLSLFGAPKAANSSKSARNFEGGVVGLGIVAAMSESEYDASFWCVPRSSASTMPIPIVSSAKPAANFVKPQRDEAQFDDDSEAEAYTCVISHSPNHSTITKRYYFDDRLHAHANPTSSMLTTYAVFSASPVNFGHDYSTEFWTADFLEFCNLCNKQLHGVDIFIYRGERAFCSAECRESYISNSLRNDDYKEKLRSSASIKPLDCSISPCSGPPLSFAGIVAA